MFSGAGGALARRRRDISTFPQSPCYLILLRFLVILTLLFCKPSLSLSVLHETLQICNIDRRRPPASFLSVDILAPWLPDPAKEETFESKRTSTLNSETSLSSFPRSLESRSVASLGEYLPHRIPQKATLTSPCSLMRFFSTLITRLSNLKLISWSSVPLPEPVKKLAAAGRPTLIYLVDSLHGLGPISSPTKPNCQVIGPTSISTQPICQVVGPIHNLIWHRPRSESRNYFANPSSLMSRLLTSMNGLDPLVRTVSTSAGFSLQRIQISLRESSWKISKEHYILKIPLPSTLHLRLSRFNCNSNLSHSRQSRCRFMKPFVRRLHLDIKLSLLLVWLRIILDNLLLESSRTLAFEANILNELGIMIHSIRNCGYRCVFMFPSPTRLIHMPVKLHLINFLKFPPKNLKTSGIMIPIQCSGGYHNIFLQGRRLGSDLNYQGQSDYKLCVEFLNLHGQRLHVREDPPALLRLVTHQMRSPVSPSSKAMSTWQPSHPLVSSMEHTFKSSYASIVRANYDHLLVRDCLKLVFKLESYKTSKDLPSLASSSRLCIFLEDSCSLYLYFSCNPLLLSCKNIHLLRF